MLEKAFEVYSFIFYSECNQENVENRLKSLESIVNLGNGFLFKLQKKNISQLLKLFVFFLDGENNKF